MTQFESVWKELEEEAHKQQTEWQSRTSNKAKKQFWRNKSKSGIKANSRGSRRNKWTTQPIPPTKNTMDSHSRTQNPRNIKHAMNLLDESTDTDTQLCCLNYIDVFLSDPHKSASDDLTKMDAHKSMDILKCITKLFVDPKEPIRSLSIDVVAKHISHKKGSSSPWNYEVSIQYIIPIIVHCILSEHYYEKSEEIRLKLVVLLDRIVSLSSNEQELKPIAGDLMGILMKLLVDPFAAINIKVCHLIVALSTKIRVHTVSKMVIENVLPLLHSRRSNVRISAIQLIECMLMNGGHEAIQKLTGFREHNVVPLQWWFGGEVRANYFGALCRHSNHSVRKAFYQMITNVMTNMYERYDYKTLLLSFVLSGLQDEDTQIQSMTFEAMERIGTMHEKDEYNDLKKTLFFQEQAEEIKKRCLGDDDHSQLPFPFTHRPCLGSRILIREHFSRIVHAAISELNDWKEECRKMAILLLRNMLIYSEEYCTQHTELLLSSLRPVMKSEIVEERRTATECCRLIGKFVYPMVWIDYLSEIMYHEFEVHLVEVLRALVVGCPLRRLSEFVLGITRLMEYAMQQMTLRKGCEASIAVEQILKRLKATEQMNNDDDDLKQMEDQDIGFEFSSEYMGFSLQIVDQTGDDSIGSDAANVSVYGRIDKMLRKIES